MLSMEILERVEQHLDEAQSAFSLARQALRVEIVQALNNNEDAQVPTNKETTPSEFMVTTGQNLRRTFFQQFGRNIDIEDLHQLLQAALDESLDGRMVNAPSMTNKMSTATAQETSLEDEKEREPSRAATEEQEQAAIEEFHSRIAEKFRKTMGRDITAEEQTVWFQRYSSMRFMDAEFPSDGDSDDSDFNPEDEAEQEQLVSDMQEDESDRDEEPENAIGFEVDNACETTNAVDGTSDNESHREIISTFMQTEFGSDEDDSDYEPESEDMGTDSDTSEFSGQDDDDDDDDESGDCEGDLPPPREN